MNKLDKVIVFVFGLFFAIITFFVIVKNWVGAIVIGILVAITVTILSIHISNRTNNKKNITMGEMENELALMGNKQSEYLLSALPPAYKPTLCDNGISIEKNNQKIYLATNYKFSPTSSDDVAKFYRFAKNNDICKVVVMGKTPSRQTLLLASSLSVIFYFYPSKKLHAFLISQNAIMPRKKTTITKHKTKILPQLNVIFDKKRARYFALSGISLALFSIFSPIRIYYLVICAICLVCAVICLVKKR